MKVLIIEDERPASQKLIRLLREADPGLEVAAILESVEKSVNWLLNQPQPDLVFMDVQLEDGLCFEIFEKSALKAPVIFTTAYDEYSLKAFKVNSVDYLLKPVNLDELKFALEKYRTVHDQKPDLTRIGALISQLQPARKERFLVKTGEHFRPVQISAINCFFISERCNFILADNGRNYAVDYSLDKIEQMVDPKIFFRINRNMIINFSAINDIIAYSSSRLKIILAGWTEREEILVSRERVSDFKQWIDR
jgi:DNA-binding LytR/AlgR family response regulator